MNIRLERTISSWIFSFEFAILLLCLFVCLFVVGYCIFSFVHGDQSSDIWNEKRRISPPKGMMEFLVCPV